MQRHLPRIVCIAALVALPALVNAAQTDPERDILVTFENVAARATTTGTPYKNRKRYAISAEARRQANAVAREYGLHPVDHWPIKSLSVYCFVYRVADQEDRDLIVEKLRADARVESVQVLQEFETGTTVSTTYDDTYADLQHGLDTLNLSGAHRHSLGVGVRIAVIDSGADIDHEDLRGRVQTIKNFADKRTVPDRDHGTAVTSIIVANANNAKGIVGVAPEASIELYVACWSAADAATAVCDSFSLAKAIDTVLEQPPDVLNLSLTGPADPLLERLLREAFADDVIIVAARPESMRHPANFPASMAEVIDVGSSIIMEENRSGPIFAPGEQIIVALPENAYDFRSGSSLAAAHVSGVIALLLALVPEAGFETVESLLKRSQIRQDTGHFSVNACKALQLANPSLGCDS